MRNRISSIVLVLFMTFGMYTCASYVTAEKLPDSPRNIIIKYLIRNSTLMSEKQFLNLSSFNINSVTKEELMTIPNIGDVYSSRIIKYREEHGTIKTIDELLAIKGIGKKRLKLLKQYLYVY